MADRLKLALLVGIDESLKKKTQTILTTLSPDSVVCLEKSTRSALVSLAAHFTNVVLIEANVFPWEEIVVFLQKMQKLPMCRNTHILLLSDNLTPQVVAASVEYDIFQVVLQSTLSHRLKKVLQEIVSELSRPSAYRVCLTAIEEASNKSDNSKLAASVQGFIQRFPESPRAKIEFANLCIIEGKYDQAEELTRKAIKLEPNNLRGKNILARIQLLKGNYGSALAILEQCELLSPKNIDRLLMMGESYLGLRKTNEAQKVFADVLKYDPSNKTAQIGMGLVEVQDDSVNTGLTLLRDITSDDELASFFNNAGILMSRRGNFEKSIFLYKTAIGVLSKKALQAKVQFNVGLAYERHKRFADAIKSYVETLKYDGNFVRANKHLKSLQAGISLLDTHKLDTDGADGFTEMFLDDDTV